MERYRYLIVGGGLAADAAARGIRELDAEGSIGLISMEPDPPYLRPSLSKGLWKGRPVDKIWRKTERLGVDLHLGAKVTRLNLDAKVLHTEQGETYPYERLLLATGGSPVRLPFGNDEIVYFRDLRDYQRLRALSKRCERFLVIGGGFIGAEIAAALTMVGKQVVMVFPEEAIGANVFPSGLGHFLNDYFREKGVLIQAGDLAVGVEGSEGQLTVYTKRGETFEVDGAVAGLGIRPNTALAEKAGLQVENGIVVDEHLMTSAEGVYAAGDVASFYHSSLGKWMRVEHEDNAIQMGYRAGRNMAGAAEPYRHAPMFYSDLFDLGYEAVGELNSRLDMLEDWQEPFKKGVVYYLEHGAVRGVLLWNVWKAVDAARGLLGKPLPQPHPIRID